MEVVQAFSEPRTLVAAAFRLPHDGDLKVASMSTRQWGSLKSNEVASAPPTAGRMPGLWGRFNGFSIRLTENETD